MSSSASTTVTVTPWGSVDGKQVQKFTLKNAKNQEVSISSYGATIISVKTPDISGKIADVVLGFDALEGYRSGDNPYFGATVGRVANRIANGEFILDGKRYKLSKNEGNLTLHGGIVGFDKHIWNTEVQDGSVVMTLLSKDGDQGFPGDVITYVRFNLTDSGELIVDMKAIATKATPINLTCHSYFNLAGHGTHAEELYNHEVMINADRWTVTDAESIPSGELRSVANSLFDFRKSTRLGDVIKNAPNYGYDDNFCMPNEGAGTLRLIAKVVHPASGRYLEVRSNQPGVQFYTSNFLPERSAKGISGKDGKTYYKHEAFCLETQNYPDAVNHDNFPNSILKPGQVYNHTYIYKFGIQA